jgi:bifunctional DNase/RNase
MALILEGIELPRPGPHQLTASLVAGAGRRIAEIRLTDLTASVFIAQVVLDDRTTVDARPSDAITLALLTDAPITVRRAVLAESERYATEGGELVTEAEAAADDQGKIAAEALANYFDDLSQADSKLDGMTATDKLAYYKAALAGEPPD